MQAKLINRTIDCLETRTKPYDVRDTDLKGFVLRVQPSGEKSYFCDYRRPDGRRTRVRIGDVKVLTPSQARDETLKILAARAEGKDPAASRKVARQESFEVFITEQYAPWAEAHRKAGAWTVQQLLRRFAEFRTHRLSDISAWKIEKWRVSRIKAGRVNTTLNRNIAMLKAALQKAVVWGVIEANPLVAVKMLRIDSQPRIRYLSESEEIDLRAALDQRESRIRTQRRSHNEWCRGRGKKLWPSLDAIHFADHLKPMLFLSINTGIRRGELFSLKWNDLDLDGPDPILTVVAAAAKSGKTRYIPLNHEALETLRMWRAQSDAVVDLVFPNHEGNRFDNIQSSWESLLRSSGIRNFRWHDIRHHFASRLVMLGEDLNTVRELLGHSDLKMTLRYAHLSPRKRAAAVARLDSVRISANESNHFKPFG